MEHFDLQTSRTQPITFTGVNHYILTDFERRIEAIVKELEALKTIEKKADRQAVIERINGLYRGSTI